MASRALDFADRHGQFHARSQAGSGNLKYVYRIDVALDEFYHFITRSNRPLHAFRGQEVPEPSNCAVASIIQETCQSVCSLTTSQPQLLMASMISRWTAALSSRFCGPLNCRSKEYFHLISFSWRFMEYSAVMNQKNQKEMDEQPPE